MLRVLGNFEAQEEIRQKTEGKHCEWLRVRPDACTACHLNPYNGNDGNDGILYRAMESYGHWLEEAGELYDRQAFGFLTLAEISPEEFEVLRVMRQDAVLIQAQIQGVEIARLIAQLFAKADG